MSVTKRVLPSGTVTWRAKVFFERRVIAQKSYPRRVDAKRWEADQLSKLQSGTWIDPALEEDLRAPGHRAGREHPLGDGHQRRLGMGGSRSTQDAGIRITVPRRRQGICSLSARW